jgi:hypothetical protein
MKRTRQTRLAGLLLAIVALIVGMSAPEAWARTVRLDIAKIYFEYNSSAGPEGDLGVHVFLDGEDWTALKIVNPNGRTIFEVEGKGPYRELGMTELFFEGAEPPLDEVPLAVLLALFPAGRYEFSGRTVDGSIIKRTATLSHAIPAGPSNVSALLNGNSLVISWNAVTGPPADSPNADFPNEPINIVAYQVLVGAFQVRVPASTLSVTVSPEFVASLPSGANGFEVLAIEAGGNQTITEGTFTK